MDKSTQALLPQTYDEQLGHVRAMGFCWHAWRLGLEAHDAEAIRAVLARYDAMESENLRLLAALHREAR